MIDPVRRLPPIDQVSPAPTSQRPDPRRESGESRSFDRILETEISGTAPVRFSGHAQTRLASRKIELSDLQLTRLSRGVERAAEKGSRDSLVMLDNLAFIVSIKNRTVVTAVDAAANSGNVYTQIDSAVIV